MKSLIKDNPVGVILLTTAGVLLLLILLLPFISGGLPDGKVIALTTSAEPAALQISELEPIEEFAVIKQRPLFNHDRKAIVITAADADDAGSLLDEDIEDKPLNADLTGVTITKDHRIVMLFERDSKTMITAAEGEMLDGELSGWLVEKVEERNVSLKNQQGEVAELELKMFTRSLGKAPATAQRNGNKSKVGSETKKPAKKPSPRVAKAGGKNKDKEDSKPKNKPMTAAEFMRQGLEKRAAAREKINSQKKTDGSN